MDALKLKIKRHEKRKRHISLSVSRTATRPRISVFRSNLHLYGQVIDDERGVTLCSVATVQKEFSQYKNNVNDAAILGEELGKKMIEKNIKSAVFDRNGYLYHGVVKSFADGVRKAGVVF